MTRITGADQILTLLRAQLEQREKQRRKTTQGRGTLPEAQNSVSRLREITCRDDLPRSTLERALVQALLVKEFGETAINDPSFQNMLDNLHERIASDSKTSDLLRRATDELLSLDA